MELTRFPSSWATCLLVVLPTLIPAEFPLKQHGKASRKHPSFFHCCCHGKLLALVQQMLSR